MSDIMWYLKNKYQKLTKGWCKDELMDLDLTFCDVIINYLKAYKDNAAFMPADKNVEEWNQIIDDIIFGFESYKMYQDENTQIHFDNFNKGFNLFKKNFHNFSY